MSRARYEDLASVARLPAAFSAYQGDPEQMRAGAPGKVGLLRLAFSARDGGTRLASSYATGPQRVQRALYLDPSLPGMAFAFVQSVSGGVLQGDRLAIEVEAGESTSVHLTTQAATKIYRMDRNYATQRVRLTVQPRAYLEYVPDFIIPYRSARFYQETDLRVADDATLIITELVAPGRAASGEEFGFDLLWSRIHATDLTGAFRFTDVIRLQPGRTPPSRPGILGTDKYFGSLFTLTTDASPEKIVACLCAAISDVPVNAGASTLPRDDGAVLRVTGATCLDVQAAIHRGWSAVRTLLLSAPAPGTHRIKYGFEPVPATREPRVQK